MSQKSKVLSEQQKQKVWTDIEVTAWSLYQTIVSKNTKRTSPYLVRLRNYHRKLVNSEKSQKELTKNQVRCKIKQ